MYVGCIRLLNTNTLVINQANIMGTVLTTVIWGQSYLASLGMLLGALMVLSSPGPWVTGRGPLGKSWFRRSQGRLRELCSERTNWGTLPWEVRRLQWDVNVFVHNSLRNTHTHSFGQSDGKKYPLQRSRYTQVQYQQCKCDKPLWKGMQQKRLKILKYPSVNTVPDVYITWNHQH